MILSLTGVIADLFWREIPNLAKNVEIDAFVIIPNHIHEIVLLIKKTNDDSDGLNDSNHNAENNYHPRFRSPGKKIVFAIIGGYKSAVTKHVNRLVLENGW